MTSVVHQIVIAEEYCAKRLDLPSSIELSGEMELDNTRASRRINMLQCLVTCLCFTTTS